MRIYIGEDSRTQAAFNVAERTAERFGCEVIPLNEERLRLSGILTRPMDRRGGMYDINSAAPQSTEFAISRFAVPLLAHAGWCLYADSDVLFVRNPNALESLADPSKAVMVVKHEPMREEGHKMDNQLQTWYPRKNWSSIVLWNVLHPANRRLNLITLNQWPGRGLHAFDWLSDSEIGELPSEWNHLVGVDPYREDPAILHFTLGTPDMPGYEDCEYADRWRHES